MAYHTALYLFLFLPIVILFYQLTPQKKRWFVLLISSYIFFWMVSGKLLIFLVGTTIFVYFISRRMATVKLSCREEIDKSDREEKSNIRKAYKRKEKKILIFGIVVILSVLIFLKYYNFFIINENRLFEAFGSSIQFQPISLLLPIGISFYSLEAIGFMVDVFWDKIHAEYNLGKLALFLGFFPQIMEGPISMYSQTADFLWNGKSITLENLSSGCIRILWGLFKKIVIADRLYVLVQEIFNHYEDYNGIIIIVGAIAYTTQLYMEFSGCMDIVIGSGRIFGVVLQENFRQPFVSRNASEFWNRWHITLGIWFKTYIFYPVSVSTCVKKWNKFGKKNCGKYITRIGISAICLFPVWLCNGLWHGPRWSYIFYGMYYFVILLFGIAVEPLRNKFINYFHINVNALYWKISQILKTWVIIFTGELFFRANGLKAGIQMFLSIFDEFEVNKLLDGTLFSMGLDKADYLVILAGCFIVATVGFIKERDLLGNKGLNTLWTPIRWTLYYVLILAVVILGAYGAGYQQVDLIYAGF